MKTIKCWEVVRPEAGPSSNGEETRVCFSREDEANSAAFALQMAKKAATVHTLTIALYESAGEFFSDCTNQLRKSAWNKLTPEEREAVGLA